PQIHPHSLHDALPIYSNRPGSRTYCGSLDTARIAANCFDGQSVLVTGGTGSFGQRFAEIALAHGNPRKLIVFSRDELKQAEMAQDRKSTRLNSSHQII